MNLYKNIDTFEKNLKIKVPAGFFIIQTDIFTFLYVNKYKLTGCFLKNVSNKLCFQINQGQQKKTMKFYNFY